MRPKEGFAFLELVLRLWENLPAVSLLTLSEIGRILNLCFFPRTWLLFAELLFAEEHILHLCMFAFSCLTDFDPFILYLLEKNQKNLERRQHFLELTLGSHFVEISSSESGTFFTCNRGLEP
jgi:hypothetical protein